MRKGMRFAALALAAVMTVGAASTAMAGEWKKDSKGWWWQNDDGSYPTSSWQWLDGNKDGVAECYYFDNTGYMLENTKTPDGNIVNSEGAWVLDGVVQTQTAAVSTQSQQPAASQTYDDDYSGTYVQDYFDGDGVAIHKVWVLKYNKATNSITSNFWGNASDGWNYNVVEEYAYVGPTAYNGHIMFELVSDVDKDYLTFAGSGLLDSWDYYGNDVVLQRQ